MSRIRQAYEALFAARLRQLGARRPEQGVILLLDRASQSAQAEGLSPAQALLRVHRRLAIQTEPFLSRSAARCGAVPALAETSANPSAEDAGFICDAGLGGLARWLRAGGYPATWQPAVGDAELVQQALTTRAILLTTDSLLLQRRVIRQARIRAFWLPPILKIHDQLELVFREFRLRSKDPRCMPCGGELQRVDKESVWSRIPPRTRLWINDYFVCRSCHQLFWQGTHWQRIRARLAALGTAKPC